MSIKGINHIGIFAKNIDEALKLYEKILNFKVREIAMLELYIEKK